MKKTLTALILAFALILTTSFALGELSPAEWCLANWGKPYYTSSTADKLSEEYKDATILELAYGGADSSLNSITLIIDNSYYTWNLGYMFIFNEFHKALVEYPELAQYSKIVMGGVIPEGVEHCAVFTAD